MRTVAIALPAIVLGGSLIAAGLAGAGGPSDGNGPVPGRADGAGNGALVAPVVALNHFFTVVDAPTYAALQESVFFTTVFAPFEKRTTVRSDIRYTGVYWYGRRTYFELFGPGDMGPVGGGGLALGVEQPGAGARVKQAWDRLGKTGEGLVTRRTEDVDLPWFTMTSPPELHGLSVWLMEYHPEFLARWYPGLTPARSIARADVLDRYVAKIGWSDRRAAILMDDIAELVVALAPADRDSLAMQLRAVGWAVREQGSAVICDGSESVTIRIEDAGGGPTGIVEAGFSLRRSTDPATHRLGSATLRLEGSSARLRFR